jgi:hypothetical protein
VAKKGIYIKEVVGVAKNHQYAVVEFKAHISESNEEIMGQFALKNFNGKWLIIPEPTDEDLVEIKKI